VRILDEILRLGGEALALWRANLAKLITWFCLGFGVHVLGTQASALIGYQHELLATLCFVLGVLGFIGAQVLMIHSLKPGLWTPARIIQRQQQPAIPVPEQVFGDERRMDVLTAAIGPFLAVYAVWGFIDDEVRDLFFANISQDGYLDSENWSVSFAPDRLGFYAGLTVGAWVIGKLIELAVTAVRRRRRLGAWASVPEVIADGTVVFGLFMTLGILAVQARDWWGERAIAVGLSTLWHNFLDLLPDWPVWFDLTLPEALRQGVDWIAAELVPAMADRLLLPLMWLALTATVFGWRRFRGRDIAAGTRLSGVVDRLDRLTTGSGGAIGFTARLATDDFRTKYLPVAHAFRMVWRAGPWFLGSFLVLSAVLWSLENWLTVAITVAIGPQPLDVVFAIEPFQELVVGLIVVPLSIAVYAAAFDSVMSEVTRVGRRPVRQREKLIK
jgi:hypothetical protein